MKNKGFTLIELLAVIVILAIIALIATPIILNIIDDTKKEAAKRSVEMYAKAVENAVVQYQMKEKKMPTTYENIKDYIKYDGEEISCEEIEIYDDGKIYIKGIKNDNNTVLAKSYGTKQYKNGDIVYYDVVNGEGCTEKDYREDNSKTGYNGINGTDNQNSCLKFYAFNDDGSKKINLLLDHNTTAGIEWLTNSYYEEFVGTVPDKILNSFDCYAIGYCIDNSVGPITLLERLKLDTNEWNGTLKLEARDNIDYKNYKARLITVNEIVQIIRNSDKEEKINNSLPFIYFDTVSDSVSDTCNSSNTSKCKYSWLYDRTNLSCTTYGCNENSDVDINGYWTSTYEANTIYRSWAVAYSGVINGYGSGGGIILSRNVDDNTNGIRPVIEVLKSKLS